MNHKFSTAAIPVAAKRKYRVTYEYRGQVTVEVEADTEDAAIGSGSEQAATDIHGNLNLYGVTPRLVP